MHTSSRSGAHMKISTLRALKKLGAWSSPRSTTVSTMVGGTVTSMDVVFGIWLEIPWLRLMLRPRISRWGEMRLSFFSNRSHSTEKALKICHLLGTLLFRGYSFKWVWDEITHFISHLAPYECGTLTKQERISLQVPRQMTEQKGLDKACICLPGQRRVIPYHAVQYPSSTGSWR